jgi:hypothetical protein
MVSHNDSFFLEDNLVTLSIPIRDERGKAIGIYGGQLKVDAY